MRIFKHNDLGVTSAVVVDERAPDPRAQLLRVVSEAVVLQDKAVEVLREIRPGAPLDDLARRGGPLSRRFLELRREVPAVAGGELARQCDIARVVLDNHGHVIVHALEMLAADWRSPAIAAQLDRLEGLGEPAERLDALYAELAH